MSESERPGRQSTTNPPGPTVGAITSEITRLLHGQRVAHHLRLKKIEVRPQFSIADDEELLTADVFFSATLIFIGPEV